MEGDEVAAWAQRQARRLIYEKALKAHINSKVAPALREKADEFLLREVVTQWEIYSGKFRQQMHSVFNVLNFPNDL